MEKEKAIVRLMIGIYCRGLHPGHGAEEFCAECGELLEYAHQRLDKCPFGDKKPKCSSCTVHCYQPGMRHRIRNVMRYTGPRMAYLHPVMTLMHQLKRQMTRDIKAQRKKGT